MLVGLNGVLQLELFQAWRELDEGKRVVAVRLSATNTSVNESLVFTGWANGGANDAQLTDGQGQQVQTRVVPIERSALIPGETVDVVLYFDVPAEAPWKVALPMQTFGLDVGPLGFLVPETMIGAFGAKRNRPSAGGGTGRTGWRRRGGRQWRSTRIH